jgi:hypothetical protein
VQQEEENGTTQELTDKDGDASGMELTPKLVLATTSEGSGYADGCIGTGSSFRSSLVGSKNGSTCTMTVGKLNLLASFDARPKKRARKVQLLL